MSKERLEDIKRNIVGIFDMESGRIESVDIRKEDYEWLIEQADRGVEYDRYLISLEDNKHYVTGLEQQNKRYREALEFYAGGKHVAYKLDETDDDLVVDYGETARKALEESE